MKFCELKGGNIGIVEKAQETRFGMSPKYSRYIHWDSRIMFCVLCDCKITIKALYRCALSHNTTASHCPRTLCVSDIIGIIAIAYSIIAIP